MGSLQIPQNHPHRQLQVVTAYNTYHFKVVPHYPLFPQTSEQSLHVNHSPEELLEVHHRANDHGVHPGTATSQDT